MQEVLPQQNITSSPKLLDQARGILRAKRYSYKTEQSYIQWMRRFIKFHNTRHPKEMGETEINQFLTHLAVKENVAASTQNQALCALSDWRDADCQTSGAGVSTAVGENEITLV